MTSLFLRRDLLRRSRRRDRSWMTYSRQNSSSGHPMIATRWSINTCGILCSRRRSRKYSRGCGINGSPAVSMFCVSFVCGNVSNGIFLFFCLHPQKTKHKTTRRAPYAWVPFCPNQTRGCHGAQQRPFALLIRNHSTGCCTTNKHEATLGSCASFTTRCTPCRPGRFRARCPCDSKSVHRREVATRLSTHWC